MRRWYKKQVVVFIAFMLLFHTVFPSGGAALAAPGSATWRDEVPAWAQEAAAELAQADIFKGYEDGTFRPHQTLTRAELAALLSRLAEAAGRQPTQEAAAFLDVSGQWFAAEIAKASRLGLIAGGPDGLFRPLAAVNRQEAAVMLERLLQPEPDQTAAFRDSGAIPAWAAGAVTALAAAGVLTGYDDGTFRATGRLTRAEAAVIVYRAWQRLQPTSPEPRPAIIVRGADGALMTKAEVALHAPGKRAYLLRGVTDDAGRFEPAIPWGTYDIYVTGAGEIAYRKASLTKESPIVELASKPAAILEGTVKQADGRAAPGMIAAFMAEPVFYAVAELDGTFTAYVEPEQIYQLSLIHDAEIREQVARTGKPEQALQGDRSLAAVALLDGGDAEACGCSQAQVQETFQAPKAGQRLQIGTLLVNGQRPAVAGGGTAGGGPGHDVTPPAAPAGLTAQALDGAARLSWTPGNESDLAGYRLYRSVDDGASWQEGARIGLLSAYTAQGLSNGTAYVFELTAVDASGNESSRSNRVRVVPEADPAGHVPPDDPSRVATPMPASGKPAFHATVDFLYQGDDPIQTGVASGAIAEDSAAVLRGRVTDPGGEPIAGVTVSVVNEQRWGQTQTRSDGRFDMVVNGGALMKVSYEKQGYMPIHRQVNTQPLDYIVVPEVVLTPYDSKVTAVQLEETEELQVAQGSPVTDERGTRQSTVVFPKGTSAVMRLADGTEVPLPGISFRSTEYTVGDRGPSAMPGELPALVGYTYAVELSADEAIEAGAVEVTFNQPVYHYVHNYLDFPVGGIVPNGYYDRQLGQWVPADNGVVLSIVGLEDGTALIDIDGDGAADSAEALASIGMDEEERRALAELYEAGVSLWRVPIPHFTPWDHNWPFGPPRDMRQPPDKRPNPRKPLEETDPCEQPGSIIGCQDQSLGQRIPLVGTPYTLNYRSNRTPGYKERSRLEIPVSEGDIPASLIGMSVKVAIAGKETEVSFPPVPATTYNFDWDGKDAYGRMITGSQPYTVTVAYEYRLEYYESSDEFVQSFGRLGSGTTIGRSNNTVTSTRVWRGMLESPANPYRESGIAGWSLDPHTVFDQLAESAYMGDGTKQGKKSAEYKEISLRGNPVNPDSVIIDPNFRIEYFDMGEGADRGRYYIGARNTYRMFVKRLSDGTLTKVAEYDNGSSITAPAADGDGNLYLFDGPSNMIMRKRPADRQFMRIAGTTLAGSRTEPLTDGARALEQNLADVSQMAPSPDGSLYFLSYPRVRTNHPNLFAQHTLYKLTPDGRIHVMNNPQVVGGTEGQADKDGIGGVEHIVVSRTGELYILDSTITSGQLHTRIRKVSQDGSLSVVAGSMSAPTHAIADGVPAAGASFRALHFHLDRHDRLYFQRWNQNDNHTYRVLADGMIEKLELPEPLSGGAYTSMGLWGITSDGDRIYSATKSTISNNQYFQISDGEQPPRFTVDDGLRQIELDPESGLHAATVHALTGNAYLHMRYDEAGRLTGIEDSDGNLLRIERSAEGIPQAIVAPGGQRTTLTVDADGQLTAAANELGEAYTMSYAAGGLLTRLTEPEGQTSEYVYDDSGLLVEATNPAGGVKRLARTQLADGLKVDYTDTEGRTTSYVTRVTATGSQRITTDPGGARTTATKTRDSERIELPEGTIITKQFWPDPRWGMEVPVLRELRVQSPEGRTTVYNEARAIELDAGGALAKITYTNRINQAPSTVVYEAAEKRFTETSAEGDVVHTYLDDKDRVVREERPGSGMPPLEMQYDERGRLIRQTKGSQFIAYTYDDRGRVASVTDASGASKQYSYDAADRLVSTQTPGGRQYGKTYDGSGNFTGLTMPDGTSYSQQYGILGQFTGFGASGEALWTTLEHGSGGMLNRSTLASGRSVTYVREESGDKRLTGLHDEDLMRSFTYTDATDRVGSIQTMDSGGAALQRIEYSYDGSDVKEMRWAGKAEGQFSYTYDALSRLTGIASVLTAADGGAPRTYRFDTPYRWDRDNALIQSGPFRYTRTGPEGRIDTIQDGTLKTEVSYTEQGRVRELIYTVAEQVVYRAAHEHDLKGVLTKRTVSTPQGITVDTYVYDQDGQLLEAAHTGRDGETRRESYTYDSNKNRLSREMTGAGRTELTYEAYDQLSRVGEVGYVFDADGYLTNRGADEFHYGSRGELLEATIGETSYSYTYDALGRRTAREGGQGTIRYYYGHPGALQTVTASIAADGAATQYYYNEEGLLIGFERGSSRYYVITDGVGTPQQVLDASGTVVKELAYDSYGVLLSDSNPGLELLIGFAGGLEDRETGLVRFGARDYDPAAGRWTARDPILFESGQANLYAYVNNNPVEYRDPCGLFCVGFTAYEGIGGGGKVCMTDDGVSACGEIGFGIGGGLEVNPIEDLSKDGLSLEATAKAAFGPASLTLGVKLKDRFRGGCLDADPIGKLSLGPIGYDIADSKKIGLKGGTDKLGKSVMDLMKANAKAELALKTKACVSHRW